MARSACIVVPFSKCHAISSPALIGPSFACGALKSGGALLWSSACSGAPRSASHGTRVFCVARRSILRADKRNPLPVSSPLRRRRCAGCEVLWVTALATSLKSALVASIQRGAFRSVGGRLRSSPRGSRCPRLLSFSSASVVFSLAVVGGLLLLLVPVLLRLIAGVS
jgi:hypothetical protein